MKSRGAIGGIGRASLAVSLCVATLSVLAGASDRASPAGPPPVGEARFPAQGQAMLQEFCASCHNDFDKVANFSIDELTPEDLATGHHAEEWEKILRRVANGEMPPNTKAQPDPALRAAFLDWASRARAERLAAEPDPGRATIRRLNRVEYANAVRDLLALDVDFSRELPQDNSGYGFDNIADVLTVSPTLMERYVTVAGKVAQLATGLSSTRAFTTSYKVPKDGSVMNSGVPAYNERASGDLPLASRGGAAFRYYARHDGEYTLAAWLNSNTNNETDRMVEDRVAVKVPLKAGSHLVGLSFRRAIAPDESVQTLRNDLNQVPLPVDAPRLLPLDFWVDGKLAHTLQVPSYRMHERYSQQNFPRDVLQVDVSGPIGAKAQNLDKISETPSRKAVFVCKPKRVSEEEACARTILTRLARRAWRRPVDAADLAPLLRTWAAERAESDFERGIEAAVQAVLVSPRFLFVVESEAAGRSRGLTDLELATRLSLFLWSSIPDEELLGLAETNKLRDPTVLDAQITRMLGDPRAEALTRNFAGQWLYLRNLDQQRPDITVFPQFDARLRAAMATETEMFFDHVLRSDRPVLDFIAADYTFLNQRLASHYGIPGVDGTAFRKVALQPQWNRGGLLGQASVLTVTSYGNHTSVVRRGKWILDNMLASPPPPPPPDIPALKAEHDGRMLTARQQLELHRTQPACAACHVKMDPLGFALENFDAVGAFRTADAGQAIDNAAVLPDGTKFAGLQGLQAILMDRKDEFTRAFTERMMTYALARGLVANDMPAVRAISQDAAKKDYRIQTIVRGIVASDAFRMRKTAAVNRTALGSALK